MAKQAPAPKMRWYQTLWQAYKVTARYDKKLPWILGALFGVPLIAGIVFGVLTSGIGPKIYGPLMGLSTGILLALFVMTRRFEKTMFAQMEGVMGGSLAVAQSIRTGWQFAEEPVAVDQRSKAVVFQGVGTGGIVLLVEGGQAAKRTVDQTSARLSKLVSGVPVTPIYVGTAEGQVRLTGLVKAIRATRRAHYGRGLGKGLSSAEQETVRARLRAMGGAQLGVPKGIDPLKARADRKGLRGK